MRSFYLVFKQAFQELVTSKSYLLTTLSLIAVSILVISLPTLLENFTSSKEEKVVVVLNTSDIQIENFEEQLTSWSWTEIKSDQIDFYKQEAQEGSILGVYVVDEGASNYEVNYFSKNNANELNSELAIFLQAMNMQRISVNNQLSVADQHALFTPVAMERGTFTEESQVSNLITYLMLMFIMMAVMMYGNTIATGVASEKATRVMEVMVTKVHPLAMIFGKIFGIALAGLLQYVAFFSSVGLFLKSGIVEPAQSIGGLELNLSALTIQHCVLFFVFFLLGYFLYASLFAVFGSMVSRPEELNGSTTPLTLLLMASAFSGILFVMSDPTSTLAKYLSVIPFTSPFNMIILVTKDAASVLDITISIGVLIVTTFVVGYFAAKIYPKGILHFGESLKLSQLIMRK